MFFPSDPGAPDAASVAFIDNEYSNYNEDNNEQ
jgi:hypothetical protein